MEITSVLIQDFPKLLNLTSTALVLAKKPDKADDEEKQEEDEIKSFLLPTLDKQNGESDDSLLLAESFQPFLLQSL